MAGLVSVSGFGYSFSDTLFSLGPGDVSLAYLLSVVSMAGIILTNDNEELLALDSVDKMRNSDMADYYMYAILATAALLVGWLFLPEIQDFVTSSDVWGVAYIGVNAAAAVALGWMY